MRIGIDLGGTKIAAGLVDERSGIVAHFTRRPTRAGEGKEERAAAIICDIIDMARELNRHAVRQGTAIDSIGIAVPELVDNENAICSEWNFPLPNLESRVSAAVGEIAVTIDSDVRAAARAEARFGAGAAASSFIYISLGTGMSYSFCMKGEPWRGKNGFAIHFASSLLALPLSDKGNLHRANAEDFASGKGIEACYKKITGFDLADGVRSLEVMAAAGDALAKKLLDEAAEVTGRLIGQIINMLDPEMVVLGGGLGVSGGRYIASLDYFMRESIWAKRCRDIALLQAKLGEKTGVIGAALAQGASPALQAHAL